MSTVNSATAMIVVMQTPYQSAAASPQANACRWLATSATAWLMAVAAVVMPVCDDAWAAARSEDALRQALTGWLASAQGVAADRIEVLPLDRRVQVPDCGGGWRFDFPFSSRDTVRARCEIPSVQYHLRTRLQAVRATIRAQRALPAGHPLNATDLIPDADGSPTPDPQRSTLIGRRLNRPVVAGEPIADSDLHPASLEIYRLRTAMRAGQVLRDTDVTAEAAAPSVAVGRVYRGPLPDRFVLARDLPSGAVLLTDDQALLRTILVAQTPLARGTRLSPALFETKEATTSGPLAAHAVSDPVSVIDMELVRDLRAGETVRASDLRPALMVRKGDLVTLTTAPASGLVIRAKVEALQDGRRGESIKIKNRESGRIMSGIVNGINSVEVP